MFTLSVSPTFTAPVAVDLPTNNGKLERRNFDGVFKRLDAAELKEYRRQLTAGELDDDGFARIVLVGWEKVTDEHKAPVLFSDTLRDQLLNIHPVTPAVIKAFFTSINGAAEKN